MHIEKIKILVLDAPEENYKLNSLEEYRSAYDLLIFKQKLNTLRLVFKNAELINHIEENFGLIYEEEYEKEEEEKYPLDYFFWDIKFDFNFLIRGFKKIFKVETVNLENLEKSFLS